MDEHLWSTSRMAPAFKDATSSVYHFGTPSPLTRRSGHGVTLGAQPVGALESRFLTVNNDQHVKTVVDRGGGAVRCRGCHGSSRSAVRIRADAAGTARDLVDRRRAGADVCGAFRRHLHGYRWNPYLHAAGLGVGDGRRRVPGGDPGSRSYRAARRRSTIRRYRPAPRRQRSGGQRGVPTRRRRYRDDHPGADGGRPVPGCADAAPADARDLKRFGRGAGGRIVDHPRFAYRGVMLDVARHFFDGGRQSSGSSTCRTCTRSTTCTCT